MADYKKYKVGITAKEPWANNISYEVLDYTLWRVEDGGDGCGYIALKDNIGVTPSSDPTTWMKSAERGQSIYDYCIEYGLFEGTEEDFAQTYTNAVNAANTAAYNANQTNEEVIHAESLRVSAEQERVSAESGRVSAENTRDENENGTHGRVANENARQLAEQGRVGAESDRVNAEADRVLAEQGRVNSESSRVSAESDRVSEWAALKTDVETARGQADAAAGRATAAAGVCDEYNQHPPRISTTTLCWEIWDVEHDEYVDTGVDATNVPYATFDIDTSTGQLVMTYGATYAGPSYSLNTDNGNLQITI